MAQITALICDAMSVGALAATQLPSSTYAQNGSPATARIRTVLDPHIVMESLGGFISADFTIPPEEALVHRSYLKQGCHVWLFDGNTPIFYGVSDQPTWTQQGECQLPLIGFWGLLARTRMREVWDTWDMSKLVLHHNSAGQAIAEVTSTGAYKLGFTSNPNALNAGDTARVDYFLFDEATGSRDAKLITAFQIDIIDAQFNANANIEYRIYGRTSPSDTTPDLLASGTTVQTITSKAASWTNTNGYRCISIHLYVKTNGNTLNVDRYMRFGTFRVGTQQSLFNTSGGTDTGKIAKNIVTGKGLGVERYDIPHEFYYDTDSSGVYLFGRDPIVGTGSYHDSGFNVTGFSALEWTSPQEILTQLVALDGFICGFYFPYNARSGYDYAGSNSTHWLAVPPQFTYQDWAAPTSPDYVVTIGHGAKIEPDDLPQPLVSALYANYQTVGGVQQSVVTDDTDTANYLYAQGFRRSEDWTIQPAGVDATLASTLAQRVQQNRRQPFGTAKITIENDGVTNCPVMTGAGAVPSKLALLRPGVYRISDQLGSPFMRVGQAHRVEWWGQTIDAPERVEITLGQPGQARLDRTLNRLAYRENHRRVR